MKIVANFIGWLFTLLFLLLFISMLLTKNWLAAVILFIIVLLCLPLLNPLLKKIKIPLLSLFRIISVLVLLFVFSRLITGAEAKSIYASPEVQSRFIEIYDEKMQEWPVPFEDVFLESEYGLIHVVVSGPKDGTPMLLLHASGVASWSWKYNIQALSETFRTYAVDLIGDAGKSEFTSLDHVMHTGKDQADLYANICDQLGIEKAFVVGASEGGFIGSNFAIHYPERVEKLALLGPMGYSGAGQAILRITCAQLFPLEFVQKSTFNWAFSSADVLQQDFTEWFILLMTDTVPIKVPPLTLPAEQRQSISVPVLFVFGERDNLVGDPQGAIALVQDMQNVEVEIVPAGHLMGGELPQEVNSLVLDFFNPTENVTEPLEPDSEQIS